MNFYEEKSEKELKKYLSSDTFKMEGELYIAKNEHSYSEFNPFVHSTAVKPQIEEESFLRKERGLDELAGYEVDKELFFIDMQYPRRVIHRSPSNIALRSVYVDSPSCAQLSKDLDKYLREDGHQFVCSDFDSIQENVSLTSCENLRSDDSSSSIIYNNEMGTLRNRMGFC